MAIGMDETTWYQSLADPDPPVVLPIGPVTRFQHRCTAKEPLVQTFAGLHHAPLAQLGQGRLDEEYLLHVGFANPSDKQVGADRQGTPAMFDRVAHKLSADEDTTLVDRLVSMITFQSQ